MYAGFILYRFDDCDDQYMQEKEQGFNKPLVNGLIKV